MKLIATSLLIFALPCFCAAETSASKQPVPPPVNMPAKPNMAPVKTAHGLTVPPDPDDGPNCDCGFWACVIGWPCAGVQVKQPKAPELAFTPVKQATPVAQK